MANKEPTIVETLSQQLADFPRQPTTYDIIKELAPAIAEARQRGADFQAIAKLFAGAGLQLSAATIRTYLRRMRREQTQEKQRPPARAQPPSGTIATTEQPPQTIHSPSSTPTKQAAVTSSTPALGHFIIKPDRENL